MNFILQYLIQLSLTIIPTNDHLSFLPQLIYSNLLKIIYQGVDPFFSIVLKLRLSEGVEYGQAEFIVLVFQIIASVDLPN